MNRGFYTIMCAQFLSSLADNALLIAAIALLTSINAPDWMTPLLKLFFVVSYVCLAAWVGIFADSMPKGRVMFLTNFVKAVGCLLMLFGGPPLFASAIRGGEVVRHSHRASPAAEARCRQRLDRGPHGWFHHSRRCARRCSHQA